MPTKGQAQRARGITESCWWCRGTGWVIIPGKVGRRRPCPRCGGSGRVPMLRQPTLPGEKL